MSQAVVLTKKAIGEEKEQHARVLGKVEETARSCSSKVTTVTRSDVGCEDDRIECSKPKPDVDPRFREEGRCCTPGQFSKRVRAAQYIVCDFADLHSPGAV